MGTAKTYQRIYTNCNGNTVEFASEWRLAVALSSHQIYGVYKLCLPKMAKFTNNCVIISIIYTCFQIWKAPLFSFFIAVVYSAYVLVHIFFNENFHIDVGSPVYLVSIYLHIYLLRWQLGYSTERCQVLQLIVLAVSDAMDLSLAFCH